MGLQALTGKEQQFQHAYEVSGRGCRISRVRNKRSHGSEHQIVYAYEVGNIRSNMPTMYQVGAAGSHGLGNYRLYMPTRHQEGTAGSHGFEIPDRTCLLGVRTVLHDLTGSEHKIVHAYNVSGRSCRISRVGNYRSYMPTRHQEGTSGSHGFETPDRTYLVDVRTAWHDIRGSEHKIVDAFKVSGRGCKISRVRNTRLYMHRRYQEGAAGSQV